MVAEDKGPPEPSEATSQPQIEWTPYAELHLINSLGGLKAIGINHHFCMAIVWQRFTTAMHINVSPETLRKRLETFYDFVNADKLVGEIPFPNEQVDFSLPEDEFPGLKLEQDHHQDEGGGDNCGKSSGVKLSSGGGHLSKKDLMLSSSSGKRFSSPIIPTKSRAQETSSSSKKERKDSATSSSTTSYSKHTNSSPSTTISSSGSGKKEVKRGGGSLSGLATINLDDSWSKKKTSVSLTSLSGGTSSSSNLQEADILRTRDVSQLPLKFLKDSRVVLTKSKIDDISLSVKKGIKLEEDKKHGLSLGKKRQSRLSDTKPGSPTPNKRARH